jgi:hypothetical protein
VSRWIHIVDMEDGHTNQANVTLTMTNKPGSHDIGSANSSMTPLGINSTMSLSVYHVMLTCISITNDQVSSALSSLWW